MTRLLQDIRYAVRQLTKTPLVSAIVILSLALGIGANTAIFSIINAVMLRSLPVEDPSRLVALKNGDGGDDTFTNVIWEQVRAHQNAFSGVLAYSAHPVADRLDLSNAGESRFVQGMWVSGNFFGVLGVPAMQGRTLTAEDDQHGGGRFGPVAVISYQFWKRNFPGESTVVGKTISLNRHTFEIVGVTPAWFTGLDADHGFDVAVPIGCALLLHSKDEPGLDSHDWWWLRILGRLSPGETLQQADARMKALAPRIYRESMASNLPKEAQQDFLKNTFTLKPVRTGFSDAAIQYRTALFALMGIAGFVLLIACMNIANLFLARAVAREREFSVRVAMGASRWSVARQLLSESLLFSLLGAAGGFLVANWGSHSFVRLLSTNNQPLELNLSPDPHLLGFTILVSVTAALLFGVAPALRGSRVQVNQALKEIKAAEVGGSRGFTVLKILVMVQLGLSLVLLFGAGLFIGTMRNLTGANPGFNRHNILLITVNISQAAIGQEQRVATYQQILERLRALPGVTSAASSAITPMSGMGWAQFTYPEGFTAKSQWDTLAMFNRVSPDYFRTMQTRLIAGRDFSDHDDLSAQKVMIITEAAARAFFGSANPIAKSIMLSRPGGKDPYEVIGVAEDSRYYRVDEAPPKTIFLASSQDEHPGTDIRYELRSDRAGESLIPAVRSAVSEQNRDISLEFREFESLFDESLAQPRTVALLSLAFGSLALLLAMIGLYGITAYAVSRRQSEIGIRMALGATRHDILRVVIRDLALLLAIGISVGIAASLAAGRLIGSLLYGVSPTDPLHLVPAVAVLALAATAAAYIPARRAAKVDPMVALRHE